MTQIELKNNMLDVIEKYNKQKKILINETKKFVNIVLLEYIHGYSTRLIFLMAMNVNLLYRQILIPCFTIEIISSIHNQTNNLNL